MKAKNKKLILSLIKDNLINTKLINGLYTGNYFLHLNDTIFKPMGFEDKDETDSIFERHMELVKRAMFLDISKSNKPIDDLAVQIYTE